MSCRRGVSLLGSLAGVLLLGVVARTDEIVLVPDTTVKAPGGRITGKVQNESPSAVKIQPNTGATLDVPVDQIESVSYTGAPANLAQAQIREKNGDIAGAADLYKKAMADVGTSQPTLADAAQFGYASMLASQARNDPARLDDALAQLDSFVKAHANSRNLGAALNETVRLSLLKGDTAHADDALSKLAAIPWAADRAAVLKAKVLSKKGKNDESIKALDEIIKAAPQGSAKRLEARLARAETLAADNKYAEAEAGVREVIDETPPEKADVQALAHNTLGDCLRAAGKPKDALFAYLKTDILYDKDRDEHSRALFQIAQLWRKLSQNERADEAMARLRERYPQSPYLKASTAK